MGKNEDKKVKIIRKGVDLGPKLSKIAEVSKYPHHSFLLKARSTNLLVPTNSIINLSTYQSNSNLAIKISTFC